MRGRLRPVDGEANLVDLDVDAALTFLLVQITRPHGASGEHSVSWVSGIVSLIPPTVFRTLPMMIFLWLKLACRTSRRCIQVQRFATLPKLQPVGPGRIDRDRLSLAPLASVPFAGSPFRQRSATFWLQGVCAVHLRTNRKRETRVNGDKGTRLSACLWLFRTMQNPPSTGELTTHLHGNRRPILIQIGLHSRNRVF
jgi:hypothetical protein